jgi:ABC-type phosphate transport system substrate-binding protein
MLSLAFAAAAHAQGRGYKVIVHPRNPVGEVDREFLAAAFLKRTTRFADGTLIRPVDREPSSSVRERFSESVIGRSAGAVRNYWQQALFSGRALPPPELDSDARVVDYVLRNRGGIGYVSESAETGEARVIAVR